MCDTSEKICIGFIGLGLIGGSIAKTLRKVHPEYKLMAYCRTKATIEEAIQEGVIDIALEERDDRFADCDYIFLCACRPNCGTIITKTVREGIRSINWWPTAAPKRRSKRQFRKA